MKIRVKFDVQRKLVYQLFEEQENEWKISPDFPLPWGEMEISGTIEGSVYASAGGCWYWKLPDFTIMGYGEYNPWVKFKFEGTIIVTSKRDHFKERLALEIKRLKPGKKLVPNPGFGFKWGWRQDDFKWIYLDGKLSPCDEYIAEKLFAKIFNEKKREKKDDYYDEYLQGHLTGKRYYSIGRMIVEDKRFKKITDTRFSRRKIFNHQFFGENIQILYIQPETWAVIVPKGGYVVSPDHLDESIELVEGITIFTHPFPDDEID